MVLVVLRKLVGALPGVAEAVQRLARHRPGIGRVEVDVAVCGRELDVDLVGALDGLDVA